MYEYNYLAHYGIARRSGRYPWGSGDRPYQGDSIRRPKKRGLLSSKKKKKVESIKKPSEDASVLEKAEYERAKRKALATGTATEVLQFKGDLTQKEMQDALSRINLERNLKDVSTKEADDGWNAVNRVMKKVGNVKDWAKTGLEIYNMIDEISTKAAKKSQGQSKNKK